MGYSGTGISAENLYYAIGKPLINVTRISVKRAKVQLLPCIQSDCSCACRPEQQRRRETTNKCVTGLSHDGSCVQVNKCLCSVPTGKRKSYGSFFPTNSTMSSFKTQYVNLKDGRCFTFKAHLRTTLLKKCKKGRFFFSSLPTLT